MTRYRFIDARKAEGFPVAPTCRVAGVATELRRRGYCVNHKRTERLMAENAIVAKDKPGMRTCGDITYVPTGEGWLYLASVLDLGSRRLVGFAMGERMPWELCRDAIDMAAETRCGDVEGMLFHHDRGSQYLSQDFRAHCRRLGIVQTVGRVGSCHDNNPAESFWATLKRELVRRFRFETRNQARHTITAWITHYNATRLHSSLGNVPPIEWDLSYRLEVLQAA